MLLCWSLLLRTTGSPQCDCCLLWRRGVNWSPPGSEMGQVTGKATGQARLTHVLTHLTDKRLLLFSNLDACGSFVNTQRDRPNTSYSNNGHVQLRMFTSCGWCLTSLWNSAAVSDSTSGLYDSSSAKRFIYQSCCKSACCGRSSRKYPTAVMTHCASKLCLRVPLPLLPCPALGLCLCIHHHLYLALVLAILSLSKLFPPSSLYSLTVQASSGLRTEWNVGC